jgi:acyl-CoA thioester hydrolase
MIHSTSSIRVRYAETDQMGFLHHGHYAAYFEEARVHWLAQLGMPYRELESQGYFLPVLELQIRFLHPNRFDDLLSVQCRLETLPRVKIELFYEVCRDGLLTTTAKSVHAFMGTDGKAMRPPPAFLDGLSALLHPKTPQRT